MYDLSVASMPRPCTPDQKRAWLTDRRSKLMKVTARYERSGNGHGNCIESNENVETVQNQDDDRKDYLGKNKSTLLYFWELAERNDILKSTMAELDSEQMVNTEHIPLASGPTADHTGKKEG